MRSFDWQQKEVEFFSKLRKLSINILNNIDSFMIVDDLPISAIPEKYHSADYDFVRGRYLTYSGRYVFPVKDTKGDVMGFCGYDKFEQPKYLDSKNTGYYAKRELFGMENIKNYYKDGYTLVTEGSICALALRDEGINALSFLGSYISPYAVHILKRFGKGCICIPDNDETGNKFAKTLRKVLPNARIIQMIHEKDYDEERIKYPEITNKIKYIIKYGGINL